MSNLPGIAYRCRNDKNRTMEFISHGCHELTGYPAEELSLGGRVPYGEIIHPEDCARFLAASIDFAVVERLKKIPFDAAQNRFGYLATMFLSDAPNLIEALKRALLKLNFSVLSSSSQTLNSISTELGALRMADLCRQAEEMGPTSSTVEIEIRLDQMLAEYANVKEKLESFLPKEKAAA